jgi:hypothetical protein
VRAYFWLAAELLTEEQQETVDAAAELLYGLIHARYILTSKGLAAMVSERHAPRATPSSWAVGAFTDPPFVACFLYMWTDSSVGTQVGVGASTCGSSSAGPEQVCLPPVPCAESNDRGALS